jgi:hypothetical protein
MFLSCQWLQVHDTKLHTDTSSADSAKVILLPSHIEYVALDP